MPVSSGLVPGITNPAGANLKEKDIFPTVGGRWLKGLGCLRRRDGSHQTGGDFQKASKDNTGH